MFKILTVAVIFLASASPQAAESAQTDAGAQTGASPQARETAQTGASAPGGTGQASQGNFRTPAKRYGAAYSVKMTLLRDGFTYDIPMWVKPEQKVSQLDREQMAELGWTYPNFKNEEMRMAGQVIEAPAFQNAKTEWAYVPDFPKSCCYGVIGQDILKRYQVRFDPNPPAHLEWIKLQNEGGDRNSKSALDSKLLSALFTLRSTHLKSAKENIDLARTPYVLNLAESQLNFEKIDSLPTYRLKGPLFQYHFAPPARKVFVDSVSKNLKTQFAKYNFKPGILVTKIAGQPATELSRFEVDDYLSGRRGKSITLVWDKGHVTYNFETNEISETEAVPAATGRH